jgi:hypothetical protein|tara:strand:- start:320 stop:910 length:591 start_codon:yes stop_codon:yes gene_type:complete
MSEAFVYLWYDAPNKKYYLGKHKGSPKDKYTHSSTIWESFTKDNIPKGVTRRILAYGTDEEMCILENKLLINRKKRCWNRYYNNSLGDPRYVDQFGENNPMWKGGITYDMKEYMKEYEKTPQRKEASKKRDQTPQRKAYKKEYGKTPQRKAYQKEYQKAYKKTPKYKANRKKYQKAWRARKKLEKQQGVATLEKFL